MFSQRGGRCNHGLYNRKDTRIIHIEQTMYVSQFSGFPCFMGSNRRSQKARCRLMYRTKVIPRWRHSDQFCPIHFSYQYSKKSWDNRYKVTVFSINLGPLWQYNYDMINNKFNVRIELVIWLSLY